MQIFIFPKSDEKLGNPDGSGTITLTDLNAVSFVRLQSKEELEAAASALITNQLATRATESVLGRADELLKNPINLAS